MADTAMVAMLRDEVDAEGVALAHKLQVAAGGCISAYNVAAVTMLYL